MTLKCEITEEGIPDTLYNLEWYKDNRNITKFGTKYHLIDDDKRRLQIKDVDKTDSGNYTCHFVNKANGTGENVPFALTVRCKYPYEELLLYNVKSVMISILYF